MHEVRPESDGAERFRRSVADDVPTGILAALPAESRSARELVRHGWRLVRSGVGGEPARAAAERLLAAGMQRLLVWGTAGGLDPALASGTVLVPAVVIGPDGLRHVPDPDWREMLLRAMPAAIAVSAAPLATLDSATGTATAKAALWQATGAGAADMETASAAAAAEAAGLPWAAIRVVADPAQSTLPRAVLDAVGARHLVSRLLLGLLVRPWELRAVMQLAREFRLACRNLERIARALVD